MDDDITREKLKLIGNEIEIEFNFKSLDIQILIDDVLDLNLLDDEKLKMFDCCCFVHHYLAYNFVEVAESFSIQSGCYIYSDVVTHSSFLDTCLKFSQYLV